MGNAVFRVFRSGTPEPIFKKIAQLITSVTVGNRWDSLNPGKTVNDTVT